MGLFGGSSKSTSSSVKTVRQAGVEGEDNTLVTGKNSTIIDEFPESVAKFSSDLLGVTSNIVDQSFGAIDRNNRALSDVATREKSPEAGLAPFMLIGSVALAAVLIWGK